MIEYHITLICKGGFPMEDSLKEIINRSNPALVYTLSDFVDLAIKDETTYRKTSILEKIGNIEFVDHNLFDEYKDYIDRLSVETELTEEEFLRYKYAPDLLAYDFYGSVQLDYLILLMNGMIDPKEFCKKKIKLISTSTLQLLINEVMQTNAGYLEQNRENNDILI